MYKKYFGFKERPFKLLPNPKYLFVSRSHEVALAHLTYAVSEGDGFIAITGEAGTGKTTLCRAFIEKMDDHSEVAYIFNPKLTAIDLLRSICDEFEIKAQNNGATKDLIDALNRFLIEKKAKGKHAMLIIDEAQNLSCDVLEQIRLLSNLETSKEKLLQIVLVGQSELTDLLNTHELRQLKQRISLICKLAPLTFEESVRYIQHRVQTAGQKENIIFSGLAMRKIHNFAKGIPRLIHTVCDRSLLIAFVSNSERVNEKIAESAIQELMPVRQKVNRIRTIETKKTLLLACMLCVAVALFFVIRPTDSSDVPKTTAQKKINNNGPVRSKVKLPDADEARSLMADAGRSSKPSADGGAIPEAKTISENKKGGSLSDNGSHQEPEKSETKTEDSESMPPVEKTIRASAVAPDEESAQEAIRNAVAHKSSDSSADQDPTDKRTESKTTPQKKLAMLEESAVVAPETSPASETPDESISSEENENMDYEKASVKPDVAEEAPSTPIPEDKPVLAPPADSGTEITSLQRERAATPSSMAQNEKTGLNEKQVASDEKNAETKNMAGESNRAPEVPKEDSSVHAKGDSEAEKVPSKPNDSESVPASKETEFKTALASVPRPDTDHALRTGSQNAENTSMDLRQEETVSEQKAADEGRLKTEMGSDTRGDAPTSSSGADDRPGKKLASQSEAEAALPDATYKPGEVDSKPRLISGESPKYPSVAKRNNIKGWVVLQFVVNTNGLVGRAEVLEASPKGIFDAVALEAAESYKFKPAKKNGKTVNCLISQRVRFELD